MSSDDFVAKVKEQKCSLCGDIDGANEAYIKLCKKYIASNSPVNAGDVLQLENSGVNPDISKFKRRTYVFVVDQVYISSRPDGHPLIMAELSVNTRRYGKDINKLHSNIKAIVHGILHPVVFSKI